VRIFMLVILVHWLAAIWYSVAGAWRGAARAEMGVPVSDLDLVSQYVFTYYATLLMVMGDDINPTTRDETIYVTLVVLVGSCVNASIFAAVANLVAQMSASSALHQRKMDGVAAAMRILKVNDATARRIRAYFEYTWTRHRDHAGDLFIGSLPYQLRSRVSCLVHEPRIRQCPIFANLDRKLVAALSISLSPEVYLPGEFILVAGYVSRCMYFVARGRVQVIRKREHVGAASSAADSHKVVYEERRDYLDELGLFTDSRPALSARSLTHTDLYKLTRADFERAISEYPAPALEMADAVHSMLQPSVAKLVSKRIYEVLQREGPPTIIRRVSQLRSSRRSSTGVGEEASARSAGVRRRETVTLSAGAAAAAADQPPSPGSPGSEIVDTRAAHGPPGANGEWSAESTGAAESPRLEELEALERMLAGDDGGGGGKKRGSTVARAAAGAAVVLGDGGGEGGAATLEQLQSQQLALFALQKEMATQLDAVAAALGIGEGGGDAEGGDGDGDGAVADPPKREKRLSEAGEVLSDALAPLGSQLDGVVAPRMTGGGIF
jgi:CRP-like cAMP-binding protein